MCPKAHINRTQKENTLGKKDTNSITVFETNKGLKKVEERIIKERERRETETDEQKEGRGK